MGAADLVTLWAWAGVVVVALTIAAWARYAMIRNGAEDEVARLRVPVAATVALVVVLLVLVMVEPAPTS